MTSSYGNVIGTPRDQLPDISDTNYLATDADLTEAVNEQIDDNIKDTKRFYDDMIEIEKNRTQALDRRLQALSGFLGSAQKFSKALEADRVSKEIDNVRFAGDKKSIEQILELQKEEKKQDFFLMEIEGLLKSTFDRTGGKVDIRANSDAAYQTLSDIEFSFNRDENIRTQLRGIDPSTVNSAMDSLLGALGFDDITDPLEKTRVRKAAEQMVRNKIHVSMLESGYDIASGSYKKQFLKIVQPGITQFLKDRDWHKYNPNGIYVMTTLMTEMMKYVHQTFSETYADKEDVNPVFYHFMLSVLLDFMSEMQTYISEVKH